MKRCLAAGPTLAITGTASLGFWSFAKFAMTANNREPTLFESEWAEIQDSLNGDGESYRHLVERYQERIGRQMWRFSRDPREHQELVQDVFVEAYRSLNNYAGQAPFEHWLARIATRVGYRFWKQQERERKHGKMPLEEWDQLPESSANALDPEEAARILHELLAQLSPRDRLVLTMRYLDEKSVSETAELAGWSQSMVKVQIWRARQKLRKLYDIRERRRIDA